MRLSPAAVLFTIALLPGCAPPHTDYEVGELEEERVLRAVKGIAGGIEMRDAALAVATFAPDYADPAFDRGLMMRVAAADGVVVADWSTGNEAPADGVVMREWFAGYVAEWKVVSRAQAKVRRIDVSEDGLYADGLFFFDVYGVSAASEAREDHMYAHLKIEKRSGAWKVTRFRIVSLRCMFAKKAQFRSVAREAGAEVVHTHIEGWKGALAMPEVGADSGLACGDFDGDGFYDLYLCNGGPKTLLRNRGDGTFEDVTARAGLAEAGDEGRGAAFGDFDNDGDPDLFVSNTTGTPSRLWRNDGDGTFTDVTGASGIDFKGFGTSVSLADVDRDGLLDIYQCQYGDYTSEYPVPPAQKHTGTNLLWRNLGGLKFEEVAADYGLDDRGWSLAATWGDVNDDGWPDLVLGNDFGDKKLYMSDGEGGFDEVAEDIGIYDRGFGMSAALGDTDNDGDFDVFFSNMYSNTNWIFTQHELLPVPWFLGWLRTMILGDLREMTMGNAFFVNDRGTFRNGTARAGVGYGQWAWSSEFLDFDADGDLDLYCVNGFYSGVDAEDL
ncbi:MAG: VCBS repeat-containing protein [Planctomycetes bacterium]|nr:VCBS repeat-containing protein [Planctomycetota bacterium]